MKPKTSPHPGSVPTKQHDRPRCAMCGNLIRLKTDRVHAPHEPSTFRPMRDWHYTGNLKVVARHYAHLLVSPDGKDGIHRDKPRAGDRPDPYYEEQGWIYERRLRWVSVWDGASYLPVDGFFCDRICSGVFAQRAYLAGYRIKTSPASSSNR